MPRPRHPLACALALAVASLSGCATTAGTAASATTEPQAPAMPEQPIAADNPFFAPGTLEYGYPQFDRIKDADFAPAFDRGMAEQRAEADRIAAQADAPTFDNTIVAMERAGLALAMYYGGGTLGRARAVFGNLTSANTNPALDKLDAEYAPRFAAHRDAIYLNQALFRRIKALHDQRATLGLDAQDLWLLEQYYTDFVRAGANLAPADQARIKAINGQIASLQTKLTQNVLAEANASAVIVDSRDQLAGLSDDQIAVLAKSAADKGQPGKFRIALLNTTLQPLLAQLDNRALRQRIHEASVARGSHGGPYDNTAPIAELMKLRAEKARILGFPNYAAYSVANQTAKTPDAINAMLARLAKPAVANARKEGAVLQAMIDKTQKAKGEPSFQLAPWDWLYYTEKVRAEKYAFDENELKPYLEYHNVLDNGVFFAANQLYGLTFRKRTDLPVYQEDVETYDVFNADGSKLALIIVDPYARPSKQGGAWMSSYVDQSALLGNKSIVAFHLNVTKPADGKPSLMTWDDVNTAFHEFGHVLHGMLSDVKYPYFSGTNVPRDFVEFPSQVNEMWADWPTVLANYAKHWQTGAPMPKALLDKVVKAGKFNQGFATTEYLGAAMLDQKWHQVTADTLPPPSGVMAYEAKALADIGLDYAPVPPRYRTPYFKHIMEDYAAGYYSYIWSEVLDADTVEWMRSHGGLTRANGDRFRRTLLSRGGSKDAMQLFRDFTGKGPDIRPLLERRGLDGK